MADKYVDPAIAASGTGGSWAQAYKTLKEATDAAAAGENIFFHNGTIDPINSDTTYTLAAGVRIISTSDKVNEPPTTYASGATVDGTGTASVDITFSGQGMALGLVLKVGNSSNAGYIYSSYAANSHIEYYDCDFHVLGTSINSAFIVGQDASGGRKSICRTNGCTFTWGHASQGIHVFSMFSSYGDDFSAGSTHPTTIFEILGQSSGIAEVLGGDLSDISTIFETTPNPGYLALTGCKLKSGFTVYASAAYGQPDAWIFDCSSGDLHYHIGHWNYQGSTVCIAQGDSGEVYCSNGGARYDGTNGVSWIVSSTATCSRAFPYYSPWIDVYHSGTSAITPYVETLRKASATAYKDIEVYSQCAYKATSGSTRYTIVDDGAAPLDLTGTAQTSSSLGASDWVGEDGTNNAYMKLGPASSITPAEIGHIRMRVVVNKASVTDLYVDPKIRGLT